MLESLSLNQNFRRDDGGEEEDEDEGGEEDEVGGEEGDPQVETVGTRCRIYSKGRTETRQNSDIKDDIVILIVVSPCCDKGSDGVGGDNQGGRNGRVEFEKRTDKCKAHNPDQCVGKDKCHALQGLKLSFTFLVKSFGHLIFGHSFCE